ncbi:hypothetical protein E4T66_17520 [Sinimarinibacterium sp. CAU 1509]|uniref:hypothetical protein n=1 Tax=Sinimarinibacterium sp. CAU 1509 TaxID=2562283 RepID=UPI0010AD99BC|nr:hypothetical protein [Sinimarinibacterium sp. CAU 1509]TJY57208.1 hypothetical protein E4T66_17520 [Sinimarinibacterium sp. CAU 1509]
MNHSEGTAIEFRFVEYNETRALRDKEAARVVVIQRGAEHWLWMSKADIESNMKTFGRHPELVKAHAAYKF